MGAASSTLSASIRDRRLRKEDLDPLLLDYFEFESIQDEHGTISVDKLLQEMHLKTDVFLTHDWGTNQSNHHRVAEVNAALVKKGIITWFDEEKMEGNVREKMLEGINNCKCVVVFITERYMDKVASDNAGDNCKLEFNFAALKKGNSKMVPVVMEPGMRNTRKWRGMVDFELSGLLYVDMAEQPLTAAKMDELEQRILSVLGGRALRSAMEALQAKLSLQVASAPAPAPAPQPATTTTTSTSTIAAAAPGDSSAAAGDLERMVETKLVTWLVTEAQIAPGNAKKYAPRLIAAGVASAERLAKKLARQEQFLLQLEVDEDDCDDIAAAVKRIFGGPKAVPPSAAAPAPAPVPVPVAAVPVARPVTVAVAVTPEYVAPAPAKSYSCCVKTLTGHSNFLTSLVQLPDGRLVTGSGDNSLRVWDLHLGGQSCSAVLAGHTAPVRCIVLLESGEALATGADDNSVKIWRKQGSSFSAVSTLTGHTGFVMALLLQSHAGRLVSGARDGLIKIWDYRNGNCERTLQGHEGTVRCLAEWAAGNGIISGGVDMTIRLWSAAGVMQHKLTGHSDHVYSLAVLDGGRLVSGSRDHTARVWDLGTLRCLKTLSGHSSDIFCMTLSHDRQMLYTGSGDKSVKCWYMGQPDFPLSYTLQGEHSSDVYSVLVLSDGRLATASVDKSLKIWV